MKASIAKPWAVVTAAAMLSSVVPATGAVPDQVTYHTVALSGTRAPGMPAGVLYDSFYPPTLNDKGQVAFSAFLQDTFVIGNDDKGGDALFAGPITAPALVARSGQAAPGEPGGVFNSQFSDVILNDVGQVTFGAVVGIPNGSWRSAYLSSPSTLSFITHLGGFGSSRPALNNRGEVAFIGTNWHVDPVGGGSWYSQTLYAGTPGALAPVASTDDPAPGMPAGVHYGSLNKWPGSEPGGPARPPLLNDSGQLAFAAMWIGALYVGSPGSLRLVAQRGDPVPGSQAVAYTGLFSVYPTALNNAGQVACVGLGGDDEGYAVPMAIYAGSPGSVALVAREGSAAPGTSAGVSYARFGDAALNSAGQVAFTAELEGTGVTRANANAIFAGPVTALSLIARTGSAAPGTGQGVTYAALDGFATALDDAGQVAFTAPLAGIGVTEANDFALFLYDPTLGTRLVLREDDLFDVGVGDLRRISSIGFGFLGDEKLERALSNDGRLAFSLTFTDGSSGVFVATVPEPALGTAALAAAGLLLLRRRCSSLQSTSCRMDRVVP